MVKDMKGKPIFILLLIFINSCAFNAGIAESRMSVNTNQTTVNQNSNAPDVRDEKVKAEPVKKETDYFAHLKPEHREILRAWLKTKTYLRPAVEEVDNSMFFEKYKEYFDENMRFLRETVGKDGYQYYAVGDMNRDGKKDFAVLLVDSRKPVKERGFEDFALAIFNAPFRKGQRPNYFEEGLGGITNSYIVYDQMVKNRLFLGKFESDYYCATYYPKGRTYFFKDCI